MCIEVKRAMLQNYYQVIFCNNIKAMADMARKHVGYTGSNDFINSCSEAQADAFLRRYERSFTNCSALQGRVYQ